MTLLFCVANRSWGGSDSVLLVRARLSPRGGRSPPLCAGLRCCSRAALGWLHARRASVAQTSLTGCRA